MPSAIANSIPSTPPTAATGSTTPPTPANALFTDLFSTTLAILTGQANATSTTDAAQSLVSGLLDSTLTEGTTDTAPTDATTTGLASLLPGVAPLLIPNQPLTDVPAGTTPGVTGTAADLTRAGELRLQFAGGPATNRSTLLGSVNTTAPVVTPATTTANALPNTTVPAPTLPATEPTPTPTLTVPVVTSASQIVPVQAPVVTNLVPTLIPAASLPTAPTPAQAAADAVVPVLEAPAAAPATALTDTSFGDRPVMAGERFAAIAGTGARLTANALQAPTSFNAILNEQVAAQPPATPTARPIVTPSATSSLDLLTRLTTESEVIGRTSAPPLTASAILTPPKSGDTGDRATDTGASDAAANSVNPFAPLPASLALAAPTIAPVSAPTPTPAAQLAESITAHSHVLERDGSVEFRMRLDPPNLGPVRVSLVSNGEELRGHVIVADDAVRRMIESQLPELRQRLEAVGVNVQNFDITADANSGGGRNPYQDTPPAFAVPATATGAAPTTRTTTAARTHTGTLDVTV